MGYYAQARKDKFNAAAGATVKHYKPLDAPKVIRNKFPGTCCECSKKVEALEGIAVLHPNSAKWLTAHKECLPILADPIIALDIAADQEEAERGFAKQRDAENRAARRAYLEEKLEIDRKVFVGLKTEQHAWNDFSTWAHPFTGEGTDEEFKEFLQSSAQSSAGALRWSNGVTVHKVDREEKLVHLSESVSLAD